MSFRFRVSIVLVALLATQFHVLWIGRGYTTAAIPDNDGCFDGFSSELDGWTSQSVEIDERLFDAVGACDQINTTFTGVDGRVVHAHLGSWDDVYLELPHEPLQCYPSSGWKILDSELMTLERNASESVQIQLMKLEKDGQQSLIAFWYMRGPHVYFDRATLRKTHSALWGQSVWPPVYKVLLQTSMADEASAMDRLKRLGTALLDRMSSELTSSDSAEN